MKKMMHLRPFLFIIIALINLNMNKISAQQTFNHSTDIGNVKFKGKTIYDPATEIYVLSGSGTNMWYKTDELHFAWTKVKGDFILNTQLEFIGAGVEPHRKAGLIIRKSLDPGSPYISAAYHGDGLVSMQYRTDKDSLTYETRDIEDSLTVLQLERSGNIISMKACKPGLPLLKVGDLNFESGNDSVYIGLFICSHNPDVVEDAIFRNTRLSIPAPESFVPYKDYIGSRIEILDIESGSRKLIFETTDNLEAPNWSNDGEFLILNGRGKLFKLTIDGKKIDQLYTDFANSNNNDHGISPDGKSLVISNHIAELPQNENSIIFTLPIEGGTPKRVTQNGPSFWHGWSPDGKFLIYTAKRNNQWDIYRIFADGGEETQLTNNKALDDGSQYSSDGKYIWFNSNRSGSMEIWRMREDGNEQTQITNDEFQNWFAHESPDGKKVIFLSYLPDISSGDHPYYKQVVLRIMDLENLKPKVIVYLYGGQGTINVPSWSPDSKKVAFVSNTYNS
jgi:TolB protein